MIRPLRAIVLEARFDATPADVWKLLTETQGLANWFAPYVKAGEGVGGIVEVSWDGTAMWPTTIDVWEPERHLRWSDPAPPGPDGTPQPRLMIDWFISTDAGQTVLRLVNSGFGMDAKWDDQIDGTLGGWRYFLWNMNACLTRQRGVPRTMVSTRHKVAITRTAFWDALFSSGFLAVSDEALGTARTGAITLGTATYDTHVETVEPPFRFAARIPGLQDSLLFIEIEGSSPTGFHAGFWLSTYGLPAETTAALQQALDAAFARIIEPGVAATL